MDVLLAKLTELSYEFFGVIIFVGHILLWVSRSRGKVGDVVVKHCWRRIYWTLKFGIPKPDDNYDKNLESLYISVLAKFSNGNTLQKWEQFFPVVRSFLTRKMTYSLVSTYQNKYTLHRSIAGAASAFFWMNIFGLVIGLISYYGWHVSPIWWLLGIQAIIALVFVLGFSGSYAFYWKLFGNAIITEAYSVIYGPNDAKPSQ
jgi:hypothetical protein